MKNIAKLKWIVRTIIVPFKEIEYFNLEIDRILCNFFVMKNLFVPFLNIYQETIMPPKQIFVYLRFQMDVEVLFEMNVSEKQQKKKKKYGTQFRQLNTDEHLSIQFLNCKIMKNDKKNENGNLFFKK